MKRKLEAALLHEYALKYRKVDTGAVMIRSNVHFELYKG